jgi:HEAT repeat protein
MGKTVEATLIAAGTAALLAYPGWLVYERLTSVEPRAPHVRQPKPRPTGLAQPRPNSLANDGLLASEPPKGARANDSLNLSAAIRSSASFNLLRLPDARLERSNASSRDVATLSLLTDNRDNASAQAASWSDVPLEIVFGFGGNVVTVEQVRLLVRDDDVIGSMELLVSAWSADVGFRSLGVRALDAMEVLNPLRPVRGKVYAVAFDPVPARYVAIRLAPPGPRQRVFATELALVGRIGPPPSRYAFLDSPVKSADLLAKLESFDRIGLSLVPNDHEKRLLDDVAGEHLDAKALAEAALLAAGVDDTTRGKDYLARLEALEAEARPLIEAESSIRAKAERLLAWLHDRPLARGYLSGASIWTHLLDSQTFDDVSATTIFHLLAKRFSLPVRVLETPDHVLAIVTDGDERIVVETTARDGIHLDQDAQQRAAWQQQTGWRPAASRARNETRDVDDKGLLAMVAWSRAAALARQATWREAIAACALAMRLDPNSPSAVKSALVLLGEWAGEQARLGRFEEANAAITAVLELAPQDEGLCLARREVLATRGKTLVDAGRLDEALDLARNAAANSPDAVLQLLPACLAQRASESAVRDGRWKDALAALAASADRLDAPAQMELESYRRLVVGRWLRSLLDHEHRQAFVAASREHGQALDPSHFAFLLQRWLDDRKHTPNEARDELVRILMELADGGQLARSLDVLERSANLLPRESELAKRLWLDLIGKLPHDAPDLLVSRVRNQARERSKELVVALHADDGARRSLAAQLIARFDVRETIPALRDRIADDQWLIGPADEPTRNDPIAGGKQAALTALRQLAPGDVVEALAQALKSSNIRVAVWACEELAQEKDKASLTTLTRALEDQDAYVRRAAADALARRGDKTAVPALALRVADEVWNPVPDTPFVHAGEPYDGYKGTGSKDHALAALKQLDPTRAAQALFAATKAKNSAVRKWATAELENLGDEGATYLLLGKLDDMDAVVRTKAAADLGRYKTRSARETLCRILTDADARVRRAAADSLAQLGDVEAVPALAARVADEIWTGPPEGNPEVSDERCL